MIPEPHVQDQSLLLRQVRMHTTATLNVGHHIVSEARSSICMLTLQEDSLGLVSNEDSWWTARERESDRAIQQRAERFLQRIFRNVSQEVVLVVTHSGMIGALLSAMGRESYSATNAELIPALVEVRESRVVEEL